MTAVATEPEQFRGLRITVDPHARALEVDDVTKVFRQGPGLIGRMRGKREERKRVVAVDHVSFVVERGEIFGVLGPNGTGKSTLIRLMSTLLLPDTGRVRVFGLDVERDEAQVKRLINRVSVEASFFKKLSPMENLMYGARLYGVEPAYARRRVVEILTRLAAATSATKKTGIAVHRVNMKRCLNEAAAKGRKRRDEFEAALTRYIDLS